MSKAENESLSNKEVLLKHRINGNPIPTAAPFLPQYLSLHGINEENTEDTSNYSFSRQGSNASIPSNCFVDVAFISSDGDAFLCNKLYLIRLVLEKHIFSTLKIKILN